MSEYARLIREAQRTGMLPPVRAAAANGLQRTAAASIATTRTMYTQPMYYSPLHTPQNWQVPFKRREVYMWARFFATHDPTVAQALDIYTSFAAAGGIYNVHENDTVREAFDNLLEKLRLNHIIRSIAYEYFLLGDVFPYVIINCPHCNGSGVREDGTRCLHEGGTIEAVHILPPDNVTIRMDPETRRPRYFFLPDAQMQRMVAADGGHNLPPEYVDMVRKGEPIPLPEGAVAHIKGGNSSPYTLFGAPLVQRLFVTLAYKDKLRIAQWCIAERLIVPVRIVRIGDDERPATAEDLDAMAKVLAETVNDPNLTLVTHHKFDLQWYSASGQILQLGPEMEEIRRDILDGLGINSALLNGEGPSYGSAAIGVEAMIGRLEHLRNLILDWIVDYLYVPYAFMTGNVVAEEEGVLRPIYPRPFFRDNRLRQDTQMLSFYKELMDAGLISKQTFAQMAGFNYEEEQRRIRMEQQSAGQQQQQQQAEGSEVLQGGPDILGGIPAPPIGPEDILGGGGGGSEAPPPAPAPPPSGGGGGAPAGGGGGGGQAAGGGPEFAHATEPPPSTTPSAPSMGLGWGGPAALGARIVQRHRKTGALGARLVPSLVKQAGKAVYRFTTPELKLYALVRHSTLPPFRWYAQYPLGGPKDPILDLAFPDLKVAVEVGSHIFHGSPEQQQRDAERDAALARQGWIVLRFTDKQIDESPNEVISLIRRALIRRQVELLARGESPISVLRRSQQES